MKNSIARKFISLIGQSLLAILGASVLVWALLPLAPGDVAERVLQSRGVENPTPAEINVVREELRLDRPVVVQYFEWLSRAARGDFSDSFQTRRPVLSEIAKRLPATVLLAAAAMLIAIAVSVILGLLSVYFAGRTTDKVILFYTQAGAAVPSFLLGLIILQFVVVGFGVGKVISANGFADVWLPAFCLGIGRALDWTQILRANLLEKMSAPFSFVAEARGATRWRILWRYALPNAILPFLTVVGVGTGALLGGAAIVETVFSWNGIGSFAVEAVVARDLPVVQGFVLFTTLVYVAVNFLVDILSAAIDPRLREVRVG